MPILSLYGKNKKPLPSQLTGTDVVVFDIQDVGARFYTYISTLYYVMQACAENQKDLIVLDRPNPCDYVDGPVREKAYKSFVGMLPIPLLHGCTLGEMAGMINGEGWLGKGLQCRLQVIRVEGWKHGQPYSLPVKPSPNLPNNLSIALYPSLCPFEGTSVSIGRGTTYPFQVIGSPALKDFFPVSVYPTFLKRVRQASASSESDLLRPRLAHRERTASRLFPKIPPAVLSALSEAISGCRKAFLQPFPMV